MRRGDVLVIIWTFSCYSSWISFRAAPLHLWPLHTLSSPQLHLGGSVPSIEIHSVHFMMRTGNSRGCGRIPVVKVVADDMKVTALATVFKETDKNNETCDDVDTMDIASPPDDKVADHDEEDNESEEDEEANEETPRNEGILMKTKKWLVECCENLDEVVM